MMTPAEQGEAAARREAIAVRTRIHYEHRTPATQRIARETLNLETIETRNSDSQDFHDLAVWQIKAALEQAYAAGYKKGRAIERGQI